MAEVEFFFAQNKDAKHTEEIHDIITTPPSWILQWGITLFFILLALIICLAFFIRYPDVIKTKMIINSYNSPKPIISKIQGKIEKILVSDKQIVRTGQVLAYLESDAKQSEVLHLHQVLLNCQKKVFDGNLKLKYHFDTPTKLDLGELQSDYQNFYQSYLAYKSSVEDGLLLKKRVFLQQGIANIAKQKEQLLDQQSLQDRDYNLSKQEYLVHQELYKQRVEPLLEYKREEAKLINKEYPLQQTKSNIIQNSTEYYSKKQDIIELDNKITEEKLLFTQALNTIISKLKAWESKFIITAYSNGQIIFSNRLQQNNIVDISQELFYINNGKAKYFGEMEIKQYNMGKVIEGQNVIVKLKGYPYEEYGILWGKLEYISDIPLKDSIFISEVSFKKNDIQAMNKPIKLKNGMIADAEIITENSSLMNRFFAFMKKYN